MDNHPRVGNVTYICSPCYITWRTPSPSTNHESATSRGVCPPPKTPLTPHTKASHRSVGGNTLQRQVHITSLQIFGAKILPTSTAAHIFFKMFSKLHFSNFRAHVQIWAESTPQNGDSPIKSWTPNVTPFVPSSERHQNYSRNIKFHFSTFRPLFQCLIQGWTKRLKYGSKVQDLSGLSLYYSQAWKRASSDVSNVFTVSWLLFTMSKNSVQNCSGLTLYCSLSLWATWIWYGWCKSSWRIRQKLLSFKRSVRNCELSCMDFVVRRLTRFTLPGIWTERGCPCGLLSHSDPSWCSFDAICYLTIAQLHALVFVAVLYCQY